MLVVVASVSGAPGVSTVALGLAALWPKHPALLMEADPAGGVVAARFGLAQEPGLTSLAAVVRHGGQISDWSPFVQYLPLRFPLVVGPGSAQTAVGAVAVVAAHAQVALSGLAPVVVADVGRLYVDSPATPLLSAADAVVLVGSSAVEYLDHLDRRLPAVAGAVRHARVGLALVGRGGFPVGEVAQRLGVPVWAELPRDRWGAGVLAGRMTGRAWVRTRLGQAVRELAGTLSAVMARPAGAPT